MKSVLLILTFSFLIIANGLKSQELPVHEQYMFDYMLVNPAFAGMSEVTSLKIIHREQWIGIEDAPSTSFLLFKHRLNERTGGIGGYIFSDKNGPNSKYGGQLTWSFQALLDSKRYSRTMLSFGMSFRGLLHTLDERDFENTVYDPLITYSRLTTFVPNANAGLVLSYNQAFLGASFDNLIPWSDRMYNMTIEPVNYVVMNTHIGNIFDLSQRIQFRPSVLFKSNFHGMNQLDVNVKFHVFGGKPIRSVYIRYQNEFWFGFSYRQTLDWKNISALSLSPTFGLTIDKYTFMYLYDLGLTHLQLYHSGTHQICLGIRFFHDKYRNWGKHSLPVFTDDF
ncbi:MAG TPA: type IX secretion system membrane protein PorP/SprF [Bacteroidales bacterium]|nr:type IX secretion system membrane protein PorP/SprF [Bacteroidales bacterium]